MEDNIQVIIGVILSAFILFVFPVYLAYEKKDDISYALAMRYTQDMVDEVRNKGYITKTMYDEYVTLLGTTGNSYDVELTHTYNRFDPITKYYKKEGNNFTLVKITTQEERKQLETSFVNSCTLLDKNTPSGKAQCIDGGYAKQGIDKVEDTYLLSQEVYSTEHILKVLNSENKLLLNSSEATINCDDLKDDKECQYAYVMNVDDNFNITIKNTNITLATVIFNMVTINAVDNNTRIYVNYGGTIQNARWYGNIDYAKLKHDDIKINNEFKDTILLANAYRYKGEAGQNSKINVSYNDKYIIEFSAKPEAVTELQPKGAIYNENLNYNFALGSDGKEKSNLSISVGLNGISLIAYEKASAEAHGNLVIFPEYTYEKPVCKMTPTKKECADGDKILWYETKTAQAKATDYTNFKFTKTGANKITVTATSKVTGLANLNEVITLIDNDNLLQHFDTYTVSNNVGISKQEKNGVTYTINVEENSVSFLAGENTTITHIILSYPITLDVYTKIRVQFDKLENGRYIGTLYIDDERVAQTIELNHIPKLNMLAASDLYTTRYYKGYLRNVKISTLNGGK